MASARPPAAARRLAALHNGDRVSRAEIAWAVPAGSRRARTQRQFLRAAMAWPELAEKRGDFRRNLEEFARIMARHMSWADGTTWRTRIRVCAEAGWKSATTFKRARRQWEKWGFIGIVRPGRTADVKPMALADRNDAQVYVLAIPKRPKAATPAPVTPVTCPPTDSRSESCTDHTRARPGTPENRTGLRPDSASKPAVPPALATGAVLEKLSDRARAHFWGPFAAAGWTVTDFRFAVDHRRGGRRHLRDWRDVLYPAGWLRWRLAHWLDDDGRPVASRSQRWAASAEAAKRASVPAVRAAQAELGALAPAAAPPNSAIDQLRAARGWKRHPRGT